MQKATPALTPERQLTMQDKDMPNSQDSQSFSSAMIDANAKAKELAIQILIEEHQSASDEPVDEEDLRRSCDALSKLSLHAIRQAPEETESDKNELDHQAHLRAKELSEQKGSLARDSFEIGPSSSSSSFLIAAPLSSSLSLSSSSSSSSASSSSSSSSPCSCSSACPCSCSSSSTTMSSSNTNIGLLEAKDDGVSQKLTVRPYKVCADVDARRQKCKCFSRSVFLLTLRESMRCSPVNERKNSLARDVYVSRLNLAMADNANASENVDGNREEVRYKAVMCFNCIIEVVYSNSFVDHSTLQGCYSRRILSMVRNCRRRLCQQVSGTRRANITSIRSTVLPCARHA